jgi:hypothetical protein
MLTRLIVPGNTEKVSLLFGVCCFQKGRVQWYALVGKEQVMVVSDGYTPSEAFTSE